MMESQAWKSLDPFERGALVELYSLFNGKNNGYLFLSARELGRRCNMGKDKAAKCFHVLIERGFIRRRTDEPVHFTLTQCTVLDSD